MKKRDEVHRMAASKAFSAFRFKTVVRQFSRLLAIWARLCAPMETQVRENRSAAALLRVAA
jgi:hypothetical protein